MGRDGPGGAAIAASAITSAHGRPWRLLALVAWGLMGAGCRFVAGTTLPAHIRAVAVPQFADGTEPGETEPDLARRLTSQVRTELADKVAARADADAVLTGQVAQVRRLVLRQYAGGNPVEAQVVITARISLYDKREGRFLFRELAVSNTWQAGESGVYNLAEGQSERQGLAEAIRDLGAAIAQQVLGFSAPAGPDEGTPAGR